jgi:hypothetical protein
VKVLVAGWFSFEQMGATAGDLMARDLACAWLREAGRETDVAHAAPFADGVDWRTVDPADYSDVVFVCGPFGNGPPVDELLDRFAGRRLTGLDLTMLESLETWNPFELLLERDSSRTARPDISFLSDRPLVPLVGLVLIHPQPEYGDADDHARANAMLERLAASRDVAAIRIDTRLDENATGLRTAAQVESAVARMDVVLTTRLHGTVLALKNGVPALVIDPVVGGAKITRQARVLGWPFVFSAADVTDRTLEQAFDSCLSDDARRLARSCATRAREQLRAVRDEFVAFVARS